MFPVISPYAQNDALTSENANVSGCESEKTALKVQLFLNRLARILSPITLLTKIIAFFFPCSGRVTWTKMLCDRY